MESSSSPTSFLPRTEIFIQKAKYFGKNPPVQLAILFLLITFVFGFLSAAAARKARAELQQMASNQGQEKIVVWYAKEEIDETEGTVLESIDEGSESADDGGYKSFFDQDCTAPLLPLTTTSEENAPDGDQMLSPPDAADPFSKSLSCQLTIESDLRFRKVLVKSSELTPGDIIEVKCNWAVPCDCVLLTGSVVVNESSLTGEALPLTKLALDPNDNAVLSIADHGKLWHRADFGRFLWEEFQIRSAHSRSSTTCVSHRTCILFYIKLDKDNFWTSLQEKNPYILSVPR